MTLRKILAAPIGDLTFDDVEALIREEAEEGPRLELKRDLPANDRQGDPWMRGGRGFANPARDGLAKEVVALANAYGGAIVVGIDETDDHPKRAVGPDPILIPRIAECAERMQQALDSIIDPPIAVLEVRGIEKPESEGQGVLLIRVGPSTRAPHGHGKPPLAYMRRGSRSEPMTMRDLQSVFFETRTRGERVAALLAERRRSLIAMVEQGPGCVVLEDGAQPFVRQRVLWFRCTLVASEDLNLRADDLTRRTRLIKPHVRPAAAFGNDLFHYAWQPRLRGAENMDRSGRHFSRWFIGDQGIVDAYGLLALESYRQHAAAFAPVLFPPIALQVIGLAEILRQAAGRPEVELALECEFVCRTAATAVRGDGGAFDDGVVVPEGDVRIGPFSLGNIEDWRAVFEEIERGIWNALGLHVGERIDFDLERWLAEMRAA